MKTVLVLGVGAQGSTVARKLDEEPNVEKVICADYDLAGAEKLAASLKKGVAVKVDGSKQEEIEKAAQGVDLIVNAMPLDFGVNVLNAAINVGTNYQDFAACEDIDTSVNEYDRWVAGIKMMLTDYSEKFKANGKTAIISTGSAPGLMCVVARDTVKYLDSCDTIYMFVYEGVRSKRFIPYWWAPVVAISDMEEDAYAFENGEIIRTKPFSRPQYRVFKEMGDKELRFVEHAHDEPVIMGINNKEFFKGAQNIYFKYGGSGIEFAEPLKQANLLSHEEEDINGVKVAPFDVVLKHIPPAPRFPEDIKAIIDEGIVADEGAFVCEAYGKKDGKDVLVETHVFAPGLIDSYEKAKMSAEMYITGQSGFLYSKLFVNDKITQPGLISSDMLNDEQVKQYLEWANELEITLETEIKEGVLPPKENKDL